MDKPAKDYIIGSGNVFADLGMPNSEELLAKAELAHKIALAIDERGLTEAQAAEWLGMDQLTLSALLRGQLTGFSNEHLLRLLAH